MEAILRELTSVIKRQRLSVNKSLACIDSAIGSLTNGSSSGSGSGSATATNAGSSAATPAETLSVLQTDHRTVYAAIMKLYKTIDARFASTGADSGSGGGGGLSSDLAPADTLSSAEELDGLHSAIVDHLIRTGHGGGAGHGGGHGAGHGQAGEGPAAAAGGVAAAVAAATDAAVPHIRLPAATTNGGAAHADADGTSGGESGSSSSSGGEGGAVVPLDSVFRNIYSLARAVRQGDVSGAVAWTLHSAPHLHAAGLHLQPQALLWSLHALHALQLLQGRCWIRPDQLPTATDSTASTGSGSSTAAARMVRVADATSCVYLALAYLRSPAVLPALLFPPATTTATVTSSTTNGSGHGNGGSSSQAQAQAPVQGPPLRPDVQQRIATEAKRLMAALVIASVPLPGEAQAQAEAVVVEEEEEAATPGRGPQGEGTAMADAVPAATTATAATGATDTSGQWRNPLIAARLADSPYADLLSPNRTEAVAQSVVSALSTVLCVCPVSPLATVTRAGLLAAPHLQQYADMCAATGGRYPHMGLRGVGTGAAAAVAPLQASSEAAAEAEVPVPLHLPTSLQFHSIFVDPVSHAQVRLERNPAMLLACGHVVSRDSMAALAASRGRFKCPTCPVMQVPSQALELILQ